MFLAEMPPQLADAVIAAPASLARVLLEWRIAPGVRFFYGLWDKLRIFALSVTFGVVAGQMARAFPKSTDYVPLPVVIIAVSFLAQEIGMKALRRGKRAVRDFSKHDQD